MKIRFALICDDVQITSIGKLNLIGITDRFVPPTLPYLWSAKLIVTFAPESFDKPGPHEATARYIDADGKRADNPVSLKYKFEQMADGTLIAGACIASLQNYKVSSYGEHRFDIYDGETLLGSVSLTAASNAPPPPKQEWL